MTNGEEKPNPAEKKPELPEAEAQQPLQSGGVHPNLAALQALGWQGQLPYGWPALGVQAVVPVGASISQQTVQMWSGPHVPPEAAERYEAVLPGSFNRMLAMTENLQAAQISDSRLAMTYMRADNKRGHWLGFWSTLAAMAGAIACVALKQPWVAGAFLSVPVMAVGKALIDSSTRVGAPQVGGTAPQQAVITRPTTPAGRTNP